MFVYIVVCRWYDGTKEIRHAFTDRPTAEKECKDLAQNGARATYEIETRELITSELPEELNND